MTDLYDRTHAAHKASSNEPGRLSFAFLVGVVLFLCYCFWAKPHFNDSIVMLGTDPQKEHCLPNYHLGLLIRIKPHSIRDGDLLFWPPSGALSNFHEAYILKEVAGVPGDHLVIHNGVVEINGRIVVTGLALAKLYHKPDSFFDRDQVIPPNRYFMIGEHPLSNDSRYWGYLRADQISGFAYRLF